MNVILFVRMWVEMNCIATTLAVTTSSSSWGCELKWAWCSWWTSGSRSSSSWGCELKYSGQSAQTEDHSHPLREDVSWNILICYWRFSRNCHPLREDVSWNDKIEHHTEWRWSHPLREDVSWNVCILFYRTMVECHPLREDVSWNNIYNLTVSIADSSSSSWGCELK